MIWNDMSTAPIDRPIVVAYLVPEYSRLRGYSLVDWDEDMGMYRDEFGDFLIHNPVGWVEAHPLS